MDNTEYQALLDHVINSNFLQKVSQHPAQHEIYTSNVVCNNTNSALNTPDGLHDHTDNCDQTSRLLSISSRIRLIESI